MVLGGKPLTKRGVRNTSPSKGPHWPSPLRPHARTSPFIVTNREKESPAATDRQEARTRIGVGIKVPKLSPTPHSPHALDPQAYTVPVSSTANE